jgi:hypothetical protein
MSRQGGLRTRPYPDPTIRHSQFAIRGFFLFATRHSPLPFFSIRHSRFAIRRLFPFAIRYSPLATRYSQSFSIHHSLFAIPRLFPRTAGGAIRSCQKWAAVGYSAGSLVVRV